MSHFMESPSKKIRILVCLAGVLALSNCATTQETVQECRQSARSFCDKTVGAKAPAYPQCLETQLAACGPY
jgi:uncharacterized lipoprotein YajG